MVIIDLLWDFMLSLVGNNRMESKWHGYGTQTCGGSQIVQEGICLGNAARGGDLFWERMI